jgi:hypothetical protein
MIEELSVQFAAKECCVALFAQWLLPVGGNRAVPTSRDQRRAVGSHPVASHAKSHAVSRLDHGVADAAFSGSDNCAR